jgi:methyl-accepting chemotaxis protein
LPMTSDSNHGHHPFLSNSFTSDIQAMISEVFPSNDQLDSPDFDPIEFINARLPSEQSITELEPLAEEITSMISNLDTEISKAVEAQSAAGEQATRDVEEAKNAIHELFRKIQDIKAKSEQSENIVQEVCRS